MFLGTKEKMINIFVDNLIICLILAIDVFLIGFNYGISKIKIPFISIISITLINFIVIGSGVVFSFFFSSFVSENILNFVSIGLILLLGIINLIKFFLNCKENNLDKNNDKLLSPSECLILAFILTPDGFSASLSCGNNKINCIVFISIFVITTFLSILIGSKIGYKLSKKIKLNLSWISPTFLIIYSLIKLIICFV